jgi:hypothetical protein
VEEEASGELFWTIVEGAASIGAVSSFLGAK